MWIASFLPQGIPNPETQNLLDLCLHLSPDVFIDPSGTRVLVNLQSVTGYWQMGCVLSDPDNARHPFLQHLKLLREAQQRISKSNDSARPSAFVLAPSPSLAAWGLEQERRNPKLLVILNPLEIQRRFQELAPSTLSLLLEDKLAKSAELSKSWRDFQGDLKYLGIRNILALKELFQDPLLRRSCFDRFPILAPLLSQRLIMMSKDYSLEAHRPQKEMSAAFFPRCEVEGRSALASDLVSRFDEILRVWQLRLEARKSHLLGLEVILGFRKPLIRNRNTGLMESDFTEHPLELDFPEGLRSASEITQRLREKLLELTPEEARLFIFPLESVEIYSSGIERLNDRQLNLFAQITETNLEKWKDLIGPGLEESEASPHPSLWNDWKGNESHDDNLDAHRPAKQRKAAELATLPEQSRRPFHAPLPTKFTRSSFESLDDFILFLREKNCLHTLQHVSSPWGAYPENRYYARVGSEALYWDENLKRVCLQKEAPADPRQSAPRAAS